MEYEMEREKDRERRLGARRESAADGDLPYGAEERKRRTSAVDDDGDAEMEKRERKVARLETKQKVSSG
jgi:hypothetical protein